MLKFIYIEFLLNKSYHYLLHYIPLCQYKNINCKTITQTLFILHKNYEEINYYFKLVRAKI